MAVTDVTARGALQNTAESIKMQFAAIRIRILSGLCNSRVSFNVPSFRFFVRNFRFFWFCRISPKQDASCLSGWLGKQYTTKDRITYVPYCCLVCHHCKRKYLICTATGKIFLNIERSGLHDASSHENDSSKYLKYYQIISIHDAAVTTASLW